MFVTVELIYGTQGRRKGKENDRASVIWHNIVSVQEEDIRTCTESCGKMGSGRKGVRESNGRG
jgi:hypothetical protein